MQNVLGVAQPPDEQSELVLRFSHNIIEHLGLKLYQNKPTNVLAELVSNSWDADAENVWIDLLTDQRGTPSAIVVTDDGVGMSTTDLVQRYLVVGQQKRNSDDPCKLSANGRYLMGRKGIGKLAPFGVAREIDLLTAKDNELTWLSFNYNDMVRESGGNAEISKYRPKILAYKAPLDSLQLDTFEYKDSVTKFVEKVSKKKAGTMVLAHNLTVKRPITPDVLKESLGRRFTVTLTRSDFSVAVNELKITEEDAFPDWELRIPETGYETAFIPTPHGDKEVRCWVGFVKSAAWSNEQAGAGIYAHGKIAQDRPFFFGNKGNEIYSRYMYAVIEADWVDELNHDAISTDRTSIDWEDEALSGLYKWGEEKIKSWISTYEKHRKTAARAENLEAVDAVINKNLSLQIRPVERGHLIDLLSEVTPKLGKSPEDREKLVEATVRAWVHEPARKLIKKLWEQASEFDVDKFSGVIRELSDQLVPESLSLAVVFAQRVYALSKLERHIMHGKETQLQKLIEEFPWILDNRYEAVFPRRSLKAICDEAERLNKMDHRNVHLPENSEYTKPDFVFFGDTSDQNILIVELKGPDDTAGWPEYQQLFSYMSYLQSRYADATVEGILVARSFDEGIKKQKTQTMTFSSWQDILMRSRRDHMGLLAGLLAGTDADARDARVQQICELGGAPVTDFLKQMGERNEELQRLAQQLATKPSSSGGPSL